MMVKDREPKTATAAMALNLRLLARLKRQEPNRNTDLETATKEAADFLIRCWESRQKAS